MGYVRRGSRKSTALRAESERPRSMARQSGLSCFWQLLQLLQLLLAWKFPCRLGVLEGGIDEATRIAQIMNKVNINQTPGDHLETKLFINKSRVRAGWNTRRRRTTILGPTSNAGISGGLQQDTTRPRHSLGGLSPGSSKWLCEVENGHRHFGGEGASIASPTLFYTCQPAPGLEASGRIPAKSPAACPKNTMHLFQSPGSDWTVMSGCGRLFLMDAICGARHSNGDYGVPKWVSKFLTCTTRRISKFQLAGV